MPLAWGHQGPILGVWLVQRRSHFLPGFTQVFYPTRTVNTRPETTHIMHPLSRPLVLASLAIGSMLFYRTVTTGVAQQPPVRNGLAFDQTLPEMDGKKLIMKVADVRVPPGAKSTPHRHGCAVVVYVVSGAMRMQVRGGPDSVYRAGATFFERPSDVHQISDNASATDSAHFTATFVCDHVGPLTMPVP